MTKISKIVKQTKEYERLSRLIENIEKAIKDFDSINTLEDGCILEAGAVFFTGNITYGENKPTEKRVDVYLNSDVSELIREEIKAILKKHLAKLKKQRNALEV